jgi:hypothetical protein
LALIEADERRGTAHLPRDVVIAARPHLAHQLPGLPDPASASGVSDTPATTIGMRSPGKGGGVMPASTPSPTDRRFVIRRILPISGPIKYGQWIWDEDGAPPAPWSSPSIWRRGCCRYSATGLKSAPPPCCWARRKSRPHRRVSDQPEGQEPRLEPV